MKSIKYFLNYVLIAAIALFIAACSGANSKETKGTQDKKARLEELKGQQADLVSEIKKLEAEIAKEDPAAAAKGKAKEVAVEEITPKKFDHFIQTQGKIEAEDDIQIAAQTPGIVTAVYVQEGQSVSKGQTLAQVDNSVILRSIEGMKSQLELANTVFQRQKNLWDQKIGTEVQYLQAKTNKESLEKQIASLQEQNEMTKIKSQISGTVDEVAVKVGQNAVPGFPAFRVVNTSDLKVTANVSEAYINSIKKGSKVVVSIPELKKDVQATVTFASRSIDILSRTFVVEVKLSSYAELRPNMTGVLKIIFHTEPNALVVPVNAIQTINNEKIVYVAEAKGAQTVARKKVVTVDGVYSNLAQVKGLTAGDKVVTVGYQGLNDGEVIKI